MHLTKSSYRKGRQTAQRRMERQRDSSLVVEKSLVVKTPSIRSPAENKTENESTTPEEKQNLARVEFEGTEEKRDRQNDQRQEAINLPSPGAFAMLGINDDSHTPHDTPNDEISGRRIVSATEGSPTSIPVEATLVPPLVSAVATADNRPPGEIDKMIRTVVEEERNRTQSKLRKIACFLVIFMILAAGVVVGVVLRLQGGDDESNSAALASTPVARCRNETVVFSLNSTCVLSRLSPERLDNGSSGSNIRLGVDPPGPYAVGSHTVNLEVSNDQGRRDFCDAKITVIDNITKWVYLRNHAYRVRGCKKDWSEAVSAIGSLCGTRGHLATITSVAERDFVRNLVRSLSLGNSVFWLGGFQPPFPQDVRSNWTWVNGEGLIYNGFVDWHPGEPSSKSENCLVMTGSNKAFEWEDKSCTFKNQYVEEYELDGTIHVDGCDSGVPDTLSDAVSCTYTFTPAITKACGDRKTPGFGACLNSFLSALVRRGNLLPLEKEKILYCGSNNTSPVALCQDVAVEVAPGPSSAEPVVVEPYNFDDGSFDPDGDLIQLRVEPEGPYEVGVTNVTLSVFDGRGGYDCCQSILNVTDGNKPPVARCKQLVGFSTSSGCNGKVQIDASDLDDGSFDPEVFDQWGAWDACQATVFVRTDASFSSWWGIFKNHGYRAQMCKVNWESARSFADDVFVCGGRGHLATVTSTVERDFIRDFARSQEVGNSEFWLGGFQPPNADEPTGGWTWVNDEGLVFDGFTDWNDGEPNRPQEDCMVMLGPNRGNRWDDKPCSDHRYRYIEEVDLERSVVINGCDSGVPDSLIDVESCTYLIADEIANCRNSEDASGSFAACLDAFLSSLEKNGTLTASHRESIAVCAGIPSHSERV